MDEKPAGGPCRVCGKPLEPGGIKCNSCKSYQSDTTCKSCGYVLPATKIERCPDCKSFQGLRRHVQGIELILALVVTMLSVLGAISPRIVAAWNYRSQTVVHVLGVKDVTTKEAKQQSYVVLAEVLNTGGRPAIVRGARVHFEVIQLLGRDASIVNLDKTLLLPNASIVLELSVGGLTKPGKLSTEKVMKRLETGRLHVSVEVDEATRLGRYQRVVRSDWCRTNTMRGFFKRYVSS